MAYNAPFEVESLVTSALSGAFVTHRAAVATEQSATIPAFGDTITEPKPAYVYPHCEVSLLAGPVTANAQSVRSEFEVWVMVVDRDVDASALHTRLKVYLTALVRTFANISGGHYQVTVTQADMRPPMPQSEDPNTVWGAWSGVKVRVTYGESLS